MVRKQFYSDTIGVVLVYDVNIKTTFENIPKWEKEAEQCGLDLSKCIVVVIGNKCDYKKREVKEQIGKEYAKSKGYQFFETSAKTGQNVNEAFKYLFEGLYNKTIDMRSKYLY